MVSDMLEKLSDLLINSWEPAGCFCLSDAGINLLLNIIQLIMSGVPQVTNASNDIASVFEKLTYGLAPEAPNVVQV